MERGRGLMHSVPVGFGSGSGLFFALDGLLEALVWVVLVGLVWSGLVWLYSRLREELLLVLFCSVCLFVRSIRAVCCMLHAVLVLSCLCAFDIKLEIRDIELPTIRTGQQD